MNEFQFKPEIAEKYGVNEAIFLHSLSFWVVKNWSNNQNCHNGKYWSYDTYRDIAKRFPFWTARQVERIVASCEAQGAVLVGNFNEDKTKRTKWYTLSGDAERIYLSEMVNCISPNGEMPEPQGVAPEQAAVGPISPDGEMHFTESGYPCHQTVKSIEVTVTNLLENPHSPQGGVSSDLMFDRFWAAYPKKINRMKAKKAWDKLKPDSATISAMAVGLDKYKRSDDWQRDGGQYIPHPATWLNNRRWTDEGIGAAVGGGGRGVEREEERHVI